jgi:hypothetical protein
MDFFLGSQARGNTDELAPQVPKTETWRISFGQRESRLPEQQGSNPPTTLQKPDAGATILRQHQPAAGPIKSSSPHISVPRFTAGQLIADSYLVRQIEGGMSTVYLTHHIRWSLDLVVKIPHQDILADPDQAHRTTSEAQAWTDLGGS